MATTSIYTPIPNHISRDHVLAAIKNHDLMIKTLCPRLVSYELLSGDSTGEAVYSITDKKPLGETTFKLTLTTVEDGINSLVDAKAPVGAFIVTAKWRVVDGVLREDIEINANMLAKKMVRGNVEKSHPELHMWLLEQVTQA
jgi:hypothetical protein